MDLFDRLRTWAHPMDWEAVYTTELPRIYNYFRYRGCDDALAEDLTAATFEKVWRSRETYRRDRSAVSTWLLRIARNVAIDHYRARHAEVSLENVALPDPAPGPERIVEDDLATEHLRSLLAVLPERERELIALKYGAGLTNRAIAKQTGLSESNVGTILNRTVQALRAQMKDTRALEVRSR